VLDRNFICKETDKDEQLLTNSRTKVFHKQYNEE